MLDWGTVIVAIIGAVGLDRLVVYLLERQARKRQASAAAKTTEAQAADAEIHTLEGAYKLICTLSAQMGVYEVEFAKLRNRVAHLETQLARAYRRVEYLMAGIRRLSGQLERNKIVPEWIPDEWTPD